MTRRATLVLLIALLSARGRLFAQVAPPAVTVVQAGAGTPPITPKEAFLRALLIPGWGHASIGEPTRGAFYFLTESSAIYMIGRTLTRLGTAKRDRDSRLENVRAGLASRGITDAEAILAAQDADPFVRSGESLVEARSQQLEDWIALGVFLAFLGGADAFVSAHLKDFPTPLGLDVRPGSSGGASVAVEFRAGP